MNFTLPYGIIFVFPGIASMKVNKIIPDYMLPVCSSITVITKNVLLQNSSTNIIDALGTQPGISNISTGPAISKPQIRGLGYNRVVIVNDGIKQEGQQWGYEHGMV